MHITHALFIWLLSLAPLSVIWFLFVRGYVIIWIGLFIALPGIIADLAGQVWIDITAPLRRKKKIILDEYERFYHD